MLDCLGSQAPQPAPHCCGGRGLVDRRAARREEDKDKFQHNNLKVCRGSPTFKASQGSTPARAALAHAIGEREQVVRGAAHVTSLCEDSDRCVAARDISRAALSIELYNRSTTSTA
jgi:hypothetical protein